MKKLIILAAVAAAAVTQLHASQHDILWYKAPAKEWMEALPLGNGRLGAMVYGGIQQDTIALNEITLWAGQRDSSQNDFCGPKHLAEIRRAFLAGDLDRGNSLTNKYLDGHNSSFGTHLPLGDIVLHFKYPSDQFSHYRRQLDLASGVASTSFRCGNTTYWREYFCSYPADVLAMQLGASSPAALYLSISTQLLRDASVTATDSGLTLAGKVDYPMFGPGGVSFAAAIKINIYGGHSQARGDSLLIAGANEVGIYVDVRTDFDDPEYATHAAVTASKASLLPFPSLKAQHVADHSALFSRMDLSLTGSTHNSHTHSELPTDQRLRQAKEGMVDPDFDALFFQYGRYMQIASSRPRSPLASNLQGVWNDNLACHMGWTCDYHLDININQNYWAPNRANLPECNVPLFKYVALLAKYGSETAEKLYGANGWCAHTVTNPWGFTAPGGGVGWALCPSAGAWLATELWSHYRYTLDKEYLRSVGYPLLKGAAEFYSSYMFEDPATGYMLTGPSISPENSFRTPDGHDYSASLMPTIDRCVVAQIYDAVIEGSKILKVDKNFRRKLEKQRAKLPPLALDGDGMLKEWLGDVKRSDPSHRHSSHLLCLFPFYQITWEDTPELMEGARRSLRSQTAAAGWEDTEWSSANMLCFAAALRDSDDAHRWLQNLFKSFTRENLMTVSPKGIAGAPADIFSFDATEASVAAMCDMLLQDTGHGITLLPALPAAWPCGHVKGLCAPGAIEVALNWSDGSLDDASFTATADTQLSLHVPSDVSQWLLDGNPYQPKISADGILSMPLSKGHTLALVQH